MRCTCAASPTSFSPRVLSRISRRRLSSGRYRSRCRLAMEHHSRQTSRTVRVHSRRRPYLGPRALRRSHLSYIIWNPVVPSRRVAHKLPPLAPRGSRHSSPAAIVRVNKARRAARGDRVRDAAVSAAGRRGGGGALAQRLSQNQCVKKPLNAYIVLYEVFILESVETRVWSVWVASWWLTILLLHNDVFTNMLVSYLLPISL